jgi:hypothetical protein
LCPTDVPRRNSEQLSFEPMQREMALIITSSTLGMRTTARSLTDCIL